MGLKFRPLRADEIDCRVAKINEKGLFLLLYKDARVDQNILDETVGCMNWQREHRRDNANCVVSLWDPDKMQWISKEDTGTESNTEKEKGLASDSFKRACFNWGIGRELYSAPRIWIGAREAGIKTGNTGKLLYDPFKVTRISYDAYRNIVDLEINNEKTGKLVYQMTDGKEVKKDLEEHAQPPVNNAQTDDIAKKRIGQTKALALHRMFVDKNVDEEKILVLHKVEKLEDLTERQHASIWAHIDQIAEMYSV